VIGLLKELGVGRQADKLRSDSPRSNGYEQRPETQERDPFDEIPAGEKLD